MADENIEHPKLGIGRWQRKDIDGTALMRLLVSYRQWMVPVSEAAVAEMLQGGAASRVMFSKDSQGISRLFIFSDGDAYSRFSKSAGNAPDQHFLTTRGTWVFRMPLEGIDFIAIDPASTHEIAYGKDVFPRLKQMAAAVELEDALLELRTSDHPAQGLLPLVRDYPSYTVSIQKVGEVVRMGMAPDAKGRALAAVFTHDDAFDTYYEEGRRLQPEGELIKLKMAGRSLFEQLSKMQLDGIVFNCSGPPTPVAFALQFAQVVLASV